MHAWNFPASCIYFSRLVSLMLTPVMLSQIKYNNKKKNNNNNRQPLLSTHLVLGTVLRTLHVFTSLNLHNNPMKLKTETEALFPGHMASK